MQLIVLKHLPLLKLHQNSPKGGSNLISPISTSSRTKQLLMLLLQFMKSNTQFTPYTCVFAIFKNAIQIALPVKLLTSPVHMRVVLKGAVPR